MRFLFVAAAVAALSLLPAAGFADCSCLCVDGKLQAVCTESGEVAGNRGICQVRAAETCPTPPDVGELETYQAPEEGVENCRQAQVYDAASGDYLTARVCDVKAAE